MASTGVERPLVEIVDLVKRFDHKTVLDGLTMHIDRGETVVLIGGSGSGKTTLGRLLVGLDQPTSGHIYLDGKDLTALDEDELARERDRFAMVFQRHALLDSLSVYDNVAFPLRERRMHDERAIRERVMKYLEALGVAAAAEKLPAQLSGGMAKRVGIARAMVMQPEIIVYDEPTSGLDPITSRMVDELIDRVREQFLVTSLVITHDMASAYAVGDRVVLLANGRIIAEGPPEEVFASHDLRVEPFAISSGVDPARLAPRTGRPTADAIRARWTAAREEARGPAPEPAEEPAASSVPIFRA